MRHRIRGACGDKRTARAIVTNRAREAKKDWAELEAAWPEDEYAVLQQRAIQERLGLAEVLPLHHRARRLAVLEGFARHADPAVHGHDRQGLERLDRLCGAPHKRHYVESRIMRSRSMSVRRKGRNFQLMGWSPELEERGRTTRRNREEAGWHEGRAERNGHVGRPECGLRRACGGALQDFGRAGAPRVSLARQPAPSHRQRELRW